MIKQLLTLFGFGRDPYKHPGRCTDPSVETVLPQLEDGEEFYDTDTDSWTWVGSSTCPISNLTTDGNP